MAIATRACEVAPALLNMMSMRSAEIMCICAVRRQATSNKVPKHVWHADPCLLVGVALDLQDHVPPRIVPLRLAAYMLRILSVAVPTAHGQSLLSQTEEPAHRVRII